MNGPDNPGISHASPDTLPATADLADARAAAAGYLRRARADSTWRAYESDWRIFSAWCVDAALDALPASAQTLALFLAAQADAGFAPSTLGRRLAAIRMAHVTANAPSAHESAAVIEVMAGIRRTHGAAPRKKAPVVAAMLQQMVDATPPDTQRGRRDRVLLLLGFSAALRRSELSAMTVEDIRPRGELGVDLYIPQSKTDQSAQGQTVAVPREPGSVYCPVWALELWMATAPIRDGRLLRRVSRGDRVLDGALSGHSVGDIVKVYAKKVGADPDDFAGHSLRRGFLTSAAAAGASPWKMRDVSRHRTMQSVQGYVDDAQRFDDHAGRGLLK